MKKQNVLFKLLVHFLLLGVLLIFGCASPENTARAWVGRPLESLLEASRHGETEKAYVLPNGHQVYVTSDYSVNECKTYWEIDEHNIIVGFHREKGSWKCD